MKIITKIKYTQNSDTYSTKESAWVGDAMIASYHYGGMTKDPQKTYVICVNLPGIKDTFYAPTPKIAKEKIKVCWDRFIELITE